MYEGFETRKSLQESKNQIIGNFNYVTVTFLVFSSCLTLLFSLIMLTEKMEIALLYAWNDLYELAW